MKKEELLNKVDSRIIKGIAHRGLHNEIYTENGLKAFVEYLNDDKTPLHKVVHFEGAKEGII